MNTSNNDTITDYRDHNVMHDELKTQVNLSLGLYYMRHHNKHVFSCNRYNHCLALIPRAYHFRYNRHSYTQFKIRNRKYMDKQQTTLKNV